MHTATHQFVDTISTKEDLTDYLGQFTTDSGFKAVCDKYLVTENCSTDDVEMLEALTCSSIDEGHKGRNCLAIARKCLADENAFDAIGFTMKSMLLSPRTWASFNILRMATAQCGLSEASTDCSHKRIPSFLREIFLSKTPRFVDVLSQRFDGIEVHHAFESEITKLTAPGYINSKLHLAYNHEEICSKAGYNIVVQQGRLWFDGFNIVAWDREGRIIQNASAGYPDVINQTRETEELTVLPGTVCFLANRVASNYYHWMHDIVPRLGVLRDSGVSLDSIDYFVLPAIQKPFQKETLQHFNIGSDRIHRFPQGRYIEADSLIMPIYGSNEHLVRIDAEQWTNLHCLQSQHSASFLKSAFTDTSSQHSDTGTKTRLYISRGVNSSRSIANEEEMMSVLAKYGFTKIQLEDFSVLEQVELFSQAEVVFGPHGAGFTNIVFCQRGTKVVEIFGDYTASCFWFLSEFLGHQHFVHECTKKSDANNLKSQKNYSSTQERYRLAQFYVDSVEIEALFELAEIYHI